VIDRLPQAAEPGHQRFNHTLTGQYVRGDLVRVTPSTLARNRRTPTLPLYMATSALIVKKEHVGETI
jgi:hypothetical protein